MPISKHHKKNRPHSEWRRRRNITRANAKLQRKHEMRKAMAQMMQQQMIAEAEQQAEEEQNEK